MMRFVDSRSDQVSQDKCPRTDVVPGQATSQDKCPRTGGVPGQVSQDRRRPRTNAPGQMLSQDKYPSCSVHHVWHTTGLDPNVLRDY